MSWTLERALRHRYGSDNEVIAEGSPAAASRMLERLRRQGTPVALLVADQWTPHMTGVDLLTRAHQLHPAAPGGCCSSGPWTAAPRSRWARR
jgi:thioredoxin reductase (NADPH)